MEDARWDRRRPAGFWLQIFARWLLVHGINAKAAGRMPAVPAGAGLGSGSEAAGKVLVPILGTGAEQEARQLAGCLRSQR
ncbi:MAG: hypothetical protein MPN21_01985, partial [Thermoanaerobaculia bacterium]|nr:hypothetical protein [Thermoanaerobaculia bacterium]